MQQFVIDVSIRESIFEIQKSHDFKTETGGILAGVYDKENCCLRITDMSFPSPEDVRGRLLFYRKSQGHQEFMDGLWETSNYTKAYVGEWHTHDQEEPIPSHVDKRTWRRIAKQNNNFNDCLFMIIGKKVAVVWRVENDVISEIGRVQRK